MTDFPNKYYVDSTGKYIGQFSGYVVDKDAQGNPVAPYMVYAQPGEGAIEVATPPNDGRQRYDFTKKTFLPLGV